MWFLAIEINSIGSLPKKILLSKLWSTYHSILQSQVSNARSSSLLLLNQDDISLELESSIHSELAPTARDHMDDCQEPAVQSPPPVDHDSHTESRWPMPLHPFKTIPFRVVSLNLQGQLWIFVARKPSDTRGPCAPHSKRNWRTTYRLPSGRRGCCAMSTRIFCGAACAIQNAVHSWMAAIKRQTTIK